MKNTALIPVLFICFITYQGFAQQQLSPSTAGRIPVNSDIVNLLLLYEKDRDDLDLKYYLSKPFNLEIDRQKKFIIITVVNGGVEINPPGTAEKMVISNDIEGKLIEISDRGRELLVYFKEYNITLRFKKAQDHFDLYSVVLFEAYSVQFTGEPPQLYVSGKDNRIMGQITLPNRFDPNQRTVNSDTENYPIPTGSADYYNGGNLPSGDSRAYLIEGNGYAAQRGVLEYIKFKKGSLSNSDIELIEKYFDEAKREGVNHDIAIAQMLYWTDFMRNRERMAACNYGGLSRIDGWNGSFPYQMRDGMTEGVRAHIQHLKLYSNGKLNQQNVNPRYSVLRDNGYIGKFSTVQDIFKFWSQSGSYGNSILEIIDNLRRYTDMQR